MSKTEWMEWKGGTQPGPDDAFIQIKRRNGGFEYEKIGDLGWYDDWDELDDSPVVYRILSDMPDEILRLEARVERLEEALRAFVLFGPEDEYEAKFHDDSSLDIIVSFGDLRRARAVLENK